MKAWQRWKTALSVKNFLLQFIFFLVYLIVLIIFLNYFFAYVQRREGVVLNDPLLDILQPVNLSAYIFAGLYLAVLTGAVYLINFPFRLLRVLQTVAILYTLRIVLMYFVRLDPPAGIIPLTDPFLQHLTYGDTVITKDLFFSGHTASILILVLACRHKWLKLLLGLILIAVIMMLLWQHVHYTIDIIGAIIFTPLCWGIAKYLYHRAESSLDIQPDGAGNG